MVDWTALVWKLIIAVAPIIVSVVAKLVMDMADQMSQSTKYKVRYWIDVFIKTEQMIEPDPVKRKQWVLDQITKMFPNMDQVQLSALIESILAEIKLEYGDTWKTLPTGTSAKPSIGYDTKTTSS